MAISLFSACSTGNKFASSFGKRKYIKGYYMDIASNSPKVSAVTEIKKPIESPVVVTSINPTGKKTILSESIQLIKTCFTKVTSKASQPSQLLAKPGISVEKTPPTINSIQVDGGKHTNEGSSGSGSSFNYLSLGFLVLLILTVTLTLLFLVFAAANTLAAYDTSLILSDLLIASDILSILIAAIALARNEDGKKLAKVVLIFCSIELFLYCIGFILGFWR
jgi:hypothetical protein